MEKLNVIEKGVAVFRSATTKDSQRILALQAGKLSTVCVSRKVEIIDVVITQKKVKELKKMLEKLLEIEDFKYVLFYTPRPFADTREDWKVFVEDMEVIGIEVRTIMN